MKKILLLLTIALFPLSTFASEGNTNFWGWVSYTDNYTEVGEWTTVYSWKLYHQYKCKLIESYLDYEISRIYRKEFIIDYNQFINWTMDRVYCKVRDYQCNCIYK